MWPIVTYSLVIPLPVAMLDPRRYTPKLPIRPQAAPNVSKVNDYGYRGLRTPKHTHTHQKRRVRVTLWDGTAFTDQYLKQEGRYHYFRQHGKIKSKKVYQMNILTKSDEVQQALDGTRKGR